MEIFVVDAHALAWFIAQSPRISKRAVEALHKAERAEVETLVPTVVLAELLYIVEKKRIPVGMSEILERISSGEGFGLFPLIFRFLKG